jgi:hypothetical protein
MWVGESFYTEEQARWHIDPKTEPPPQPQNRRASLLAISQLLRTILVDTLTVYISVVIIIPRYKHSNRPRKVAHGQGYGSQNAA